MIDKEVDIMVARKADIYFELSNLEKELQNTTRKIRQSTEIDKDERELISDIVARARMLVSRAIENVTK